MHGSLTQQTDLFTPERWPKKPYCSDDKSAKWIRQLNSALKRPYIQANPPHLRVWMIFDIDQPDGAFRWYDVNLPPPTWNAIHRANGHAHTAWGLAAPVLVDSPNLRQAPLRYLCAVEAGYRAKLDADDQYSGLLTKNPAHPNWHTLFYGGPTVRLYDLEELADWVDLPKFMPKRGKNPETIGLGRNCTLFDELRRRWAYPKIREYKPLGMAGWNPWLASCRDWAMEYNGNFPVPLDAREVWHVVKSVAKWTWRHFDIAASDARFSQLQTYRGRQGGVASGIARLDASESKRASARLMAINDPTLSKSEIARRLEAPRSTVIRWLQDQD